MGEKTPKADDNRVFCFIFKRNECIKTVEFYCFR